MTTTMPAAPGRVARLGVATLVWDPRTGVVGAGLIAATAILLLLDLHSGRLGLTFADIWQTLSGHGTPEQEYAVYQLRMPRALTALLVGAALGAAGAAFQRLTRNPLGSPDIIGMSTGSATGALIGLMVLGGGQLTVAATSIAGGLGTAIVVYTLARNDTLEGYRLVLMGVGIAACLMAVNSWLITRAELSDALAAQVWLTGTLNGRGWEHVIPLAITLAIFGPWLASYRRALDVWALGSETAGSVGLRREHTRLAVVVLGVVLVAVATTATGPIAFVALVAPHLARLLSRTPSPSITVAALSGAVLLLAGDVAAQRLVSSTLPVGVATSLFGGIYLALLLAREWKAGRG